MIILRYVLEGNGSTDVTTKIKKKMTNATMKEITKFCPIFIHKIDLNNSSSWKVRFNQLYSRAFKRKRHLD